MKNVPVPVYCRPLVEKDPTMKVPPWSLGPAGGGKAGKGSTWLSPGRSGKQWGQLTDRKELTGPHAPVLSYGVPRASI